MSDPKITLQDILEFAEIVSKNPEMQKVFEDAMNGEGLDKKKLDELYDEALELWKEKPGETEKKNGGHEG